MKSGESTGNEISHETTINSEQGVGQVTLQYIQKVLYFYRYFQISNGLFDNLYTFVSVSVPSSNLRLPFVPLILFFSSLKVLRDLSVFIFEFIFEIGRESPTKRKAYFEIANQFCKVKMHFILRVEIFNISFFFASLFLLTYESGMNIKRCLMKNN